ncbi:hypothetical protein PL263_04205 [Methylomonas sp. EFPC3]|uniref:hypothetical protein n=1 Tax=Methylomonas sp. EFPC3 TaxID=3021710 RepID=UPI0024180131|nr:hypothetical protein [Methylomonas sp. EFPC3]WFP51232.1 hypothetical protein PL263_04205 [Methylomonas sp. EFPC3]
MNIENALCPTQQAKAVIDLIMAAPDEYLKDETAVYALYSVMDNLNRALSAIHELFDDASAIYQALSKRGLFEEVMAELNGKDGEEGKS